ncbi:MAG: hypothetical protein U0136_12110 [Bdellovibrionota bacterium]
MADVVSDGIGRIGSVGSLIGASMETAGHHTQSQLLQLFEKGSEYGDFGLHLVGLLYLISIIGALITLASGGNYRFGLWLLLGPPLFFFLVNVRTASQGVQWQFGSRIGPQEKVQKGVRGISGPSPGNVALFFNQWDKLVSGIVQGTIELIHVTENGSDLDFLNKTERYMSMFGIQSLDPRLKGFVKSTLVNRCADYISNKKKAADTTLDPLEREAAKAVNARSGHGPNNVVFTLADEPWIEEWYQAVFKTQLTQQSFTCEDLWQIAVSAFKEMAEEYIDLIVKLNIPPGMTEEQVRNKLLLKFGMIQGNGFVINEVNSTGVNADDYFLSAAINELTARLVFKELSETSPALVQLDMGEHPPTSREGDQEYDDTTARSIRELLHSESYQYKGELIISALTLPYIQGCVLYFLAIAYPFFAACIIIPGRHHAFLMWMGLWLWAKLWDVGFAVVMVIDNMLYALLPHGPPITDADLQDPGLAFKKLLEVDPAYSVSTYYNLVACCMLAVPIITGMLVHRGGREVVNTVSGSFREFPAKFGTSMAAYKRALMAQNSLSKAQAYVAKAVREQAPRVLMADKELGAVRERVAILEAVRARQGDMKKAGSAAVGLLPENLRAAAGNLPIPLTELAKLSDGMLGVLIDHDKEWAKRRLTEDLQMLAYNRSKDDYALEMAGEAILNRYNSHHFARAMPWKSMIDTRNAARTFALSGGVVDGAVGDLIRTWAMKTK